MTDDPDITRPSADDDALRLACRRARSADPRPNILLVFTDQQTASAMSCAGNRWVNTPWMDSLARTGVRFSDAYCAAPVSGPARGSLVTGLPPQQSGVLFNGDPLPPDLPTIGSVLRSAGYYTAWTGKWHLPESFLREPCDKNGFHHRPLSPAVPWCALGDQTDFLTAMDAEFFLRWEVAKQAKPWFLAASLHNPHDICYHVLEGMETTGNEDSFPPLPQNFAIDPDEPAALKMRRTNTAYGHELSRVGDWTEERWRAYLQTYAHLTSQVDRAVGRILQALKSGGWQDNTLVIFTSDHGDGIAAHHWATKLSLYEEAVRVPLIMTWPDKFSPRLVSTPVSALDLLPTLCDLTGAQSPPLLGGRSLRRELETGCNVEDAPVFGVLAADKDRPEIQGRMVRTTRHKFCAYHPGFPNEQFFDLATDPGETRNLAGLKHSQEGLLRHRRLLKDWCLRTGDPFAAQIR